MKAPVLIGALFISGLLAFSNQLFAQSNKTENVIDLGKITTMLETPLTTGDFYDKEEIEKTNSINLADFLTKQGYTVMNTGGTGAMSNVSIKGYAGFCIKVYVDGVLANNPTTGEFDWNQISLDSISSIEIQNFPVENQLQFAGSVIKIITKSYGQKKFTSTTQVLSYEGSLFDTVEQADTFQGSTKKSVYKIGTNLRYAKNEYLTPRNVVNDYNKSSLAQIDGSWNRYTSFGSLSATGFLGTNKIKALHTGTSYDVGVEQDINSRITLKSVIWGDKIWQTVGVNYNFVDVEYDASINNHETTTVNDIEIVYNLDFKNGLNLYNTVIEEWSPTMKAFRSQLQTKLSYEKQFTDWLKLYSSVGTDIWYAQKFSYEIIPCVRLILPFGVSFAAYREFILPTFNQLYWNGSGGVGNTNLEPENGWSGLISWKQFDFIYANLQISRYGNKIRWTGKTENGVMTPENVGNAKYLTATIGSEHAWSHFDYNGRINYTKATLEDGNQIMWVPYWTGALNLNFNYRTFVWSINSTYTGKRFIANDNRAGYYKPYLLIDVSQSWNFTKNWTLVIKGANLLDQRYIYHDNYYAPGRSFLVIVKYN